MKSYIAKLALRSDTGYELWPKGWDTFIPLNGDHDYIPLEVWIEAFVEDGRIVEWHRDYSQAGYRDVTRKHIALCLMTTEGRKESLTEAAQETARKAQNALRWACPQFDIELEVYPCVTDSPTNYGLTGPWDQIRDMMAGQHPDFHPNYFAVLGGAATGGRSGQAYINSDKAAAFNPSDWTTLVHEILHMFGLHHHSTDSNEYGGDSWMGRSNTGWGITAPDYHFLGLIQGENIRRLISDAYVHLVAPEVSDDAMAKGETKIAYAKVEDKMRAIWVRGGKVRISGTPMADSDFAGSTGRTRVVAELGVGESFDTVQANFIGYGTASVKIGGAFHKDRPEFTVPDEVSPITPGHFHNPEKTHQGIQVYRSDGQAAVYWFTWDDTGPLFLIGQGPIEGEVADLTIYHTPNKELTEVGEAVLYFRDSDSVTMKYRLTLQDRWWPGPGVLQLTRLTNPDSVDVWETGTREGVTRQVMGERELVMRWGYQFDRRVYRPRWWYGEDGILYEAVGGVANTKTDSRIERWGRYKLRPDVFWYRKDGWSDWKAKPLKELI